MPTVSFDGTNKIITLPTVGTYSSQTIYSEWKEWVATSDNIKYAKAFDAVGGDEIANGVVIAPYFFLRTDLGWRIQPPSANGSVTIEGNLFPRNTGETIYLESSGFTVLVNQSTSSSSTVTTVETNGAGAAAINAARDAIIATLSNALYPASVVTNAATGIMTCSYTETVNNSTVTQTITFTNNASGVPRGLANADSAVNAAVVTS